MLHTQWDLVYLNFLDLDVFLTLNFPYLQSSIKMHIIYIIENFYDKKFNNNCTPTKRLFSCSSIPDLGIWVPDKQGPTVTGV